MLKRIVFAVSLAVLASFSFGAGKTAYINMEQVFNDYYKTVNENISFETQRRKFMDGMVVMRDEYQNSVDEFRKAQKDMDNELLSAQRREEAKGRAQALAQRLEQKQNEIVRFRNESLAEIESKQQAVVEVLTKELLEQIRACCKEKGITVLLDVSGKTMNRMPAVLVYPESEEITKLIILRVNAGHEKERTDAQNKLTEMRKKNAEAMRDSGISGMIPPASK